MLTHTILGSGSPVVILHGLFGSLDNWATMSGKLSARFQVISVDLPNHGGSPHRVGMGYDAVADDVSALIGSLGLGPVGLIGHSMGGKVAMSLATARPERVERLAILDVAPRAYEHRHRDVLAGLAAVDLSAVASRADADRMMAPHLPTLSTRQFLLKSLVRTDGGGWRWRFNLPELARTYDDIAGAPTLTQIYGGPALFLAGGASDYLTEADQPAVRQHFPQAEFVTLPGVGHWLHAEAPAAVLELLTGFFTR